MGLTCLSNWISGMTEMAELATVPFSGTAGDTFNQIPRNSACVPVYHSNVMPFAPEKRAFCE